MKNTKLTVKFFLIIALFTTSVMADGHIGGGGLTDDGHIGGGGKTCDPQTQTCVVVDEDDTKSGDLVLDFINNYLSTWIG